MNIEADETLEGDRAGQFLEDVNNDVIRDKQLRILTRTYADWLWSIFMAQRKAPSAYRAGSSADWNAHGNSSAHNAAWNTALIDWLLNDQVRLFSPFFEMEFKLFSYQDDCASAIARRH